jgi:ribonuclease E
VEESVAFTSPEPAEFAHEPERTAEEQAQENSAHADDAAHAAHASEESGEARHGEHVPTAPGEEDDEDDGEEDTEEEQVESVGGDDVLEEVPERAFRPRRQYKIRKSSSAAR